MVIQIVLEATLIYRQCPKVQDMVVVPPKHDVVDATGKSTTTRKVAVIVQLASVLVIHGAPVLTVLLVNIKVPIVIRPVLVQHVHRDNLVVQMVQVLVHHVLTVNLILGLDRLRALGAKMVNMFPGESSNVLVCLIGQYCSH